MQAIQVAEIGIEDLKSVYSLEDFSRILPIFHRATIESIKALGINMGMYSFESIELLEYDEEITEYLVSFFLTIKELDVASIEVVLTVRGGTVNKTETVLRSEF